MGHYDPHAWQDVANVKIYVANIRDALIGVDPANKGAYQQNAENYLGQLAALDRDIRAAWADIPKQRRRVKPSTITAMPTSGVLGAAGDQRGRRAERARRRQADPADQERENHPNLRRE